MKNFSMILCVLLFAGMLTACGEQGENGPVDTEVGGNIQSTEAANGSDTLSANMETVTEIVNLKDITVEDYMTLKGDYMGLTLYIPAKAEVTDEEVELLALDVYNSGVPAEGGITDRAVEIGDIINLDYAGYKDGVAFGGGTAQNQQLIIGSGAFIDGFEDGLVGVMPGETVELNLTFPAGYRNAELAGQAVLFTVTVNFIYPNSVSEMQDEILADITGGEYETVAAFLEYCREYLEYEAEYDYTTERELAVMEATEELFSFSEVPEALQNKYAASIRASMESEAMQYGLDIFTYFSYFYGIDAESYLVQASEASAKQCMIFQYIANREGLHLSDEELEESLQRFAEENRVLSVEELLLYNDKEEFREYFMFEKVVEFIIENGQVTEG